MLGLRDLCLNRERRSDIQWLRWGPFRRSPGGRKRPRESGLFVGLNPSLTLNYCVVGWTSTSFLISGIFSANWLNEKRGIDLRHTKVVFVTVYPIVKGKTSVMLVTTRCPPTGDNLKWVNTLSDLCAWYGHHELQTMTRLSFCGMHFLVTNVTESFTGYKTVGNEDRPQTVETQVTVRIVSRPPVNSLYQERNFREKFRQWNSEDNILLSTTLNL